MDLTTYSGPANYYNGIPIRALYFYQLGEGDPVKMGNVKWLVDDLKTIIDTFFSVTKSIAEGEEFQLNGTLIGTSPVINFVDNAGVTWAITENPVTGVMSVEATATGGGGTPAGSNTEIQYNNSGAFGADSGFTRDSAKVTISGDDTGTDGVLHITTGDSDLNYIVLEEESDRGGNAYITFRGTGGTDAPFGVVFVAGAPSKYVFLDPTATELFSINISTQEVTVRNLGGIGTRMVTADTNGKLGTTAITSGTVTSVALSMPSAFIVAGSPITTSGTLAVTGAGTTAQYVRGDGSLATFPTVPTVTPAALTKTDDTNVTLTIGGTPGTALLQAVSLTLGWTGTLADGRIASASTWNAKLTSVLASTNIFVGNGSNVATGVAMSGDATLANTGALTIANSAVTYAKMQDVSATDRVLGRYTAGSGNVEELTYAQIREKLGLQYSVCFWVSNTTISVLPAAERFFGNSNRFITKVDLANYSYARLVFRVTTASTAGAAPRFRAKYKSSFDTVIGNYSDIGTSEVSGSLAATGISDSGWIALASGAKINDCFITIGELGGDGTGSPVIAQVYINFK